MSASKWPLRIYWIKVPDVGRIAVMPRPMPGQFSELKAAGVDVVVSLLQRDEAQRLGLGRQVQLCEASGMKFLHLPVIDHSIPDAVKPVEVMSKTIRQHLGEAKGVAVHCYAGLGRSPLLIASVLIDSGYSAIEACDLISAARGMTVPEMNEQFRWLNAYEVRPRMANSNRR